MPGSSPCDGTDLKYFVSHVRPLDYEYVLTADRLVYPTSSPLELQVLQTWYTRHAEFGLIYRSKSDPNVIVGNCLVVALKPHAWRELTSGHLKECELTTDCIFNNDTDDEVALHVYHMEKNNALWPSLSTKRFASVALEDIAGTLRGFQHQRTICSRPQLRIRGFSGLAVSNAGINLFANYFNCREKDYICQEHIMKRPQSSSLEVFDKVESQDDLNALLIQGYQYVTRCKMLVLNKDVPSVVWTELDRDGCQRQLYREGEPNQTTETNTLISGHRAGSIE